VKKFIRGSLFIAVLLGVSICLTGCDTAKVTDLVTKIINGIKGAGTGTGTGTVANTGTGTAATPEPAPAPTPAPTGTNTGTAQCQVTVYGTSWCGYCKKAVAYFTAKGTPFTDKDIEKDPAAKAEMEAKCKAQGINPSGVPIIDVCGTIVVGFDQAKIEAILKEKGAAAAPTPAPAPVAPPKAGVCQVTVYGTSWCGYCKQAVAYFTEKGTPFVDKDIEKDAAAKAEMTTKCQAQGITPRGVPVIDVCGTIVVGFDKARIEQLLKEKTTAGTGNTEAENPGK